LGGVKKGPQLGRKGEFSSLDRGKKRRNSGDRFGGKGELLDLQKGTEKTQKKEIQVIQQRKKREPAMPIRGEERKSDMVLPTVTKMERERGK